ncbi:MAG: hypothetical protein M5U19_05055 [Microthrixaceae bacterium]|nr:hypothetical protein [Microthrixaceae bacterium]
MSTTAESADPQETPLGPEAPRIQEAPPNEEAAGDVVGGEGPSSGGRSELRRILEAVILVAEDPVPSRLLSELTEVAQQTVEATLARWRSPTTGSNGVRSGRGGGGAGGSRATSGPHPMWSASC